MFIDSDMDIGDQNLATTRYFDTVILNAIKNIFKNIILLNKKLIKKINILIFYIKNVF